MKVYHAAKVYHPCSMKILQVLILIKFVDSPPYPKYIPAEKFLAHQRATKINYLEPKKCMLIKW